MTREPNNHGLRTYDGMAERDALLAIDGDGRWMDATEVRAALESLLADADWDKPVHVEPGPHPNPRFGRPAADLEQRVAKLEDSLRAERDASNRLRGLLDAIASAAKGKA